ncbi:SRPBCC domain-containing protein [Undibacterium sp. RuTC16W]|uniref:SRPBCC domain-containing protein n=1 Tax=Undibacterium sp. RuTC16W TaxID=3413048 RepID=UPI003BF32FF0
MDQSTNEHQIMQTQRTLPYTANEIYEAFSDPGRLMLWWGPKGFTNTFEIFEFKAGGIWKFIMHGPDGSNFHNENIFREIESGQKLVIRHVSHPHFTLTVSLLPDKEGTQVLWVQEFDDVKVADAVRHIVEPANEQNLDRLHMLLRGELK